MKKILTTIAALAIFASSAFADEGMWLLPLLQKMNAQAMADLGCRLTPEQIYSINNSSLKDAVVHFGGGCTAEVISREGLVVTNHHCGYSNIQKLSTPEHNYLEDGYWAMNRNEELPADGLSVTFLQSFTDVTDIVTKAYDKALKANKKAADAEDLAKAAMNQAAEELEMKAEAENPHCTATVTSFYNNNVYYLIVYKTYTDIRFVGAPPASSGKFGGDTDNWMWPRHTCDFSMFRIYAGKDNEPAAYSPDNKPYVPKKSLKVSLKGLEDGDFAMIMGYPGRTQRFQTAAQLRQMLAVNDVRIDARTLRQDIMWEARMADPVVNLQYASKYASSSNGWKKWQGMREAFAKLGILEREEAKEAEFTQWAASKKKRQEAYGSALGLIENAVKTTSEAELAITLLNETIGNIEILSIASRYRSAAARAKENLAKTGTDAALPAYKDYSVELDKKEAEALISYYLEKCSKENEISVPGHDIKKVAEYVDYLFENSIFTSAEKLQSMKGFIENDPAFDLIASYSEVYNKLYPMAVADQESLLAGSKAFAAGLLEWKADEPSYPDANSTMRLTYGNVKSYSPKDGVLYKHYTTLKGVMEKEDPDNYEFRVPARLKEIYETKDYGMYANKDGELVTCFLINCDITGGNSGSPVMNADGDLVGLAFDGNWESMSSDVMFEPDLQRCICVDIRYVLLMMDKFGGAGYLLNEMDIVK